MRLIEPPKTARGRLVPLLGLGAILLASIAAYWATASKPTIAKAQARASINASGHRYIMIDQFGYRPHDPKVAVLIDPKVGYNADDEFFPGKTYQVRRASDHEVVYSAPLTAFNDGKVQPSSGDRGYWFDFSSVTETGSFYLYDPNNRVRSHVFDIDAHVYRNVLKAAMRMFFYNRSGAAKSSPHADRRWIDAAAYLGPGQDGEARAVDRKDDPSTARDLRGGWFDAGDTNKYVNNASFTVHQLFSAYREAPDVWTDDFDIPESGNDIPDILDEIKWELEWLKRMQQDDGGVLIKVGTIDFNKVSPPSRDRRPRYYAPVCSSSTISAAGVFAHAATVFATVPALAHEAPDYRRRAERAWQWYQTNPKRTDCDSQEVKSGDDDRSLKTQAAEAVVAAVYLFSSTRDTRYRDYVDKNYRILRPFRDVGWTRYRPHQGGALLFYTTLSDIAPEVRTKILDHKRRDTTGKRSKQIYAAGLATDLYRAHVSNGTYHWGSNRVRANYGNSNLDLITYDLAGPKSAAYQARALGLLHYFHGVNPQGMVYLSNMHDYGAEVSASEIYHTWFAIGTPWWSSKKSAYGPAPGYLVGGPNARYNGRLAPPANQPLQKSYRDWIGNWREKSWEITEPHIISQVAYIKLLSKFVPAANQKLR